MSTELFMRGLFALLMGGCFCWAVHRNKNVEDTFDPEQNHQRYLPLVSGVILPVFVLGTAAVMLIVRPAGVEQSILSMFFSLFLLFHNKSFWFTGGLLRSFSIQSFNFRDIVIPNCRTVRF